MAVERLRDNLDIEGVHNIGITGPYGSGKSSVVKTLIEKDDNKHHFLELSLATLDDKAAEKDEKKIEANLLKQKSSVSCSKNTIKYHIFANRISNSNEVVHLSPIQVAHLFRYYQCLQEKHSRCPLTPRTRLASGDSDLTVSDWCSGIQPRSHPCADLPHNTPLLHRNISKRCKKRSISTHPKRGYLLEHVVPA